MELLLKSPDVTLATLTIYLQNSGVPEKAQQIARYESPRTTKLYDLAENLNTRFSPDDQ